MNVKLISPLIASVCMAVLSPSLHASDDINILIGKVRAVSYDCPDSALRPELEQELTDADMTTQQRFALTAAKTQFMVCEGNFDAAQDILFDWVDRKDIDTSSYAYASAIYQIGFLYDVKEHPSRCEYYGKAKTVSSPQRYSDVFLSASIGLVTYCAESENVAERLGTMFNILERYTDTANPAELATIHNSIGLIYGTIDQHALAADQYIKAHEMGMQVYKGSNRLSILISAIISLLASAQFDEAYERIVEFDRINQKIDTPLTNYHYQLALSSYYRSTGEFEKLAETLPDFEQALTKVSSSFGQYLYNWHATELCVLNGDKPCIQAYLDTLAEADDYVPNNFKVNLEYLAFNLAMHNTLGDSDAIETAFKSYSDAVRNMRQATQYSASILSSANLYSKIYDLESEVESAELRRQQTLYAAIALFLLISAAAGTYLRKKHVAAQSIDPVTQLLNSQAAIHRIGKIDAPEDGLANAIAIFDLGNFREINRVVGPTKGDYVLRQIARTLQKVTRGTDILGRFAPEQFILCLRNIEEQNARGFLERVQSALDKTFEQDFNPDHVSVRSSMSIFVTTEKVSNLDDVLDEMVMSINLNSRTA